MHRRMKIKATPNLFGGSKKSNTAENKLGPLPVTLQEMRRANGNNQIDFKENAANLQNSKNIIEKNQPLTLEPEKELSSNIAMIKSTVSPLEDSAVKNTIEISSRNSGKSLLPIQSVKHENQNVYSPEINNTRAKETISNMLYDASILHNANDVYSENSKVKDDYSNVDTVFEIADKTQAATVDEIRKEANLLESECNDSKLEKLNDKKTGQKIVTCINNGKFPHSEVQKLTSRRARFKGQPLIHKPTANKRHTGTSLVELETTRKRADEKDKLIPKIVKIQTSKGTLNKGLKAGKEEIVKEEKRDAIDFKKLHTSMQNNFSINGSGFESQNIAESKENVERTKLKESNHNKSPKFITGSSLKSDILSQERKAFYERKLNFKNKLSKGNLEKKNMTMFDLIFWNPVTNPMPLGQHENENKSKVPIPKENSSIISEAQEELQTEEEGLGGDNTSKTGSIVENHETAIDTKPSSLLESVSASNVDEERDDIDSETTTLAPQVKIGPNGELVIDEKSLTLQTTAAKNRDEVLKRTEVVEEPSESSHYGKWSKRRKRSTEWTRKETARFYKALSTVGTDFSLMETVFPWRARSELKIKFKKEERINRHLIDTALNDCTQFDFSIFNESDYDPEQDRKETKEAEKAEAKKKRESEREERKRLRKLERKSKREQAQQDKLRKKKLKKEQIRLDKLQKKRLKSLKKNKKQKALSKHKTKPSRVKLEKASSLEIQTEEVICEVVFSSPRTENISEERNHTRKEGEETEAETQNEIVNVSEPPMADPALTESILQPSSCTNPDSETKYSTQSQGQFSRENEIHSDVVAPHSQCKYSELVDEIANDRPEKRSKVDEKGESRLSQISKSYSHEECVSNSHFQVRDVSPISLPPVLCNTPDTFLEGTHSSVEIQSNQVSQILGLPSFMQSREDEEPISISTIPVSIDPGLYAAVSERTEGTNEGKDNCNVNEKDIPLFSHSNIKLENAASSQFAGSDQLNFTSAANQTSECIESQSLGINTTQDVTQMALSSIGTQPSKVIVMAAPDPNNPSGHIYHVYEVARINPLTSPPGGSALPLPTSQSMPKAKSS